MVGSCTIFTELRRQWLVVVQYRTARTMVGSCTIFTELLGQWLVVVQYLQNCSIFRFNLCYSGFLSGFGHNCLLMVDDSEA